MSTRSRGRGRTTGRTTGRATSRPRSKSRSRSRSMSTTGRTSRTSKSRSTGRTGTKRTRSAAPRKKTGSSRAGKSTRGRTARPTVSRTKGRKASAYPGGNARRAPAHASTIKNDEFKRSEAGDNAYTRSIREGSDDTELYGTRGKSGTNEVDSENFEDENEGQDRSGRTYSRT